MDGEMRLHLRRKMDLEFIIFQTENMLRGLGENIR